MSDTKNVWIFVEQDEGRIADVSLELLAKGRELAGILKSELWALVCGQGVEAAARTAIAHGADRVLLAEDPELRLYRTLPYARIVSALVREKAPYVSSSAPPPWGATSPPVWRAPFAPA